MPVAISLDAIGELGDTRFTKNLCPTGRVESRLRSEIWKFEQLAPIFVSLEVWDEVEDVTEVLRKLQQQGPDRGQSDEKES